MKRYGSLWDKLIAWDNLVLAARKAQRGKRGRADVQRFNFYQEMRLLKLQEELESGCYRPGKFVSHWVREPKPRLISAAPYRDRVVHHAVMNILEPILERHFHPDSYACRQEKGTHAAADRLQALMRRYRYALQCDIKQFFPSIDHETLKASFRRLIKDRSVLALMDLIVDTSNEQPGAPAWFAGDDLFAPLERRRGLPIGNLTSQWFANWVLTDLDHFVTSHLGMGGYLRYCDDFILLHNDRCRLRDALGRIRQRLAQLRLRLHEWKLFVRPVATGLTFVGYRLWPTHRLLRKANIHRFRRRVRWMRRAYAAGVVDWAFVKPRLASWIGHAQQADSQKLLRRLCREWVFKRDGTVNGSCSARRQLEQRYDEPPRSVPQQQHAVQSEQQHRIPFGPALSAGSKSVARNRAIHGSRERGDESPGSIPALRQGVSYVSRPNFPDGPGGAGRPRADGPAWFCFRQVKCRAA